MATDVLKSSLAKDLTKILQSHKFCTVCLNVSDRLLHLDYSLVTEIWEEDALPLRKVLEGIFKEVKDILYSDYICEPCKSTATNSYAFITKAKKTAQAFNKYLTQLDRGITNLRINDIHEQKRAVIILELGENSSKTVTPNTNKHLSRDEIKPSKHSATSSRSLRCPHCKTRPCLHEKYLLAYSEQKKQNLEKISCVECNKKIRPLVQHLIAHVNKEHLGIQTNICGECGKAFHLAHHYKKHLKYHKTKYSCIWCSEKFQNEALLNSHVEICKDTVNTNKLAKHPALPEPKGLNHFSTLGTYSAWCMKQKTQKKQARNGKIYKCLTCNKVLNTKLELRIHIKKMHAKKPNLCIYCNRQFTCRKEYLEHVQTEEHRKNMPYNIFNHQCTHCDYAANTAIMLTAHINRIHLNIRPFTCDHCQKCYFNYDTLKNHMKIHTGEVKRKVCDICGAHLAGPTALKKHRRLHTGEKPYSCVYCDEKMSCSSSLRYHVMRKHREPAFNCPLCDLKFHTINNARGHVRKTHWKSSEKFDYTKLEGLSPKDYDFFRDRRVL